MRGARHWRPVVQLVNDALLGTPGLTSTAPHVRATTGTQGLNLHFVVASLPVALLIAWNGPLAYATLLAGALLTATFWEGLFAWQRRRPVDEGVFLTAWLFALIAPANTPLWQVVLAVSFGVVFGKAVFGGIGRYLVSPPLLALVLLVFAYPDVGTDPVRWAPAAGNGLLTTLCCVTGAAWLLMTGSASWRVMAGAIVGLLAALALAAIAEPSASAAGPAWYWPLVSGGFAFGVVFIATDPTASAMTNAGRFASGVLAGLLSYLVGVMFAILLASLIAPLFDAAVVALNVRRRLWRERAR